MISSLTAWTGLTKKLLKLRQPRHAPMAKESATPSNPGATRLQTIAALTWMTSVF
jgi:hypothetical protein